jgi:hypothetical protein
MKKHMILFVDLLLILTATWVAFGQAGGGQRGGPDQMREVQLKAIAAIQEHATRLKAMMDASAKAMEGRPFQDLSEEEFRTKMRETFTEQREEQQKIVAAMEQEMMKLKGFRQLRMEQEESVAPLKEILASAQNEKAKETASKIEQLIAQRQKQFEEKMKGLGFDPTQMPQMRGQQ